MDAPPPYDDQTKYAPTGPAVGPGYPPPGAYPPAPGAYPPAPGAYPPAPAGYPPAHGAPLAYPPPAGYAPQTTQPTTVVVQQVAQPKPPDNFVLSLIACLCCNACCLGLIALVFAYQSQQEANGNRMEEARSKGEIAKKLAIASIIASCVILVIAVIANAV